MFPTPLRATRYRAAQAVEPGGSARALPGVPTRALREREPLECIGVRPRPGRVGLVFEHQRRPYAKVAAKIDSGVIVFIVCDGGWKYLSTGAYTDDLDAAEAKAESIIYF